MKWMIEDLHRQYKLCEFLLPVRHFHHCFGGTGNCSLSLLIPCSVKIKAKFRINNKNISYVRAMFQLMELNKTQISSLDVSLLPLPKQRWQLETDGPSLILLMHLAPEAEWIFIKLTDFFLSAKSCSDGKIKSKQGSSFRLVIQTLLQVCVW